CERLLRPCRHRLAIAQAALCQTYGARRGGFVDHVRVLTIQPFIRQDDLQRLPYLAQRMPCGLRPRARIDDAPSGAWHQLLQQPHQTA
ncbi:hypothetical protein, partial [Corynebacterium diphtheriae]|uniref:hypothetical protein n=1 Tax=Corynebacterium diphtheriae TaxID=1717 RepID=UPI0015E6C86C